MRKIWIHVVYYFLEATVTCKQTAILWGEIVLVCAFFPIKRSRWNVNTHKHTLSCLTIVVVLNFCGIVQQTRQVAPVLCSVERGQRGAGQMAPSTMFSHWFHCRNRSDWSLYLSQVLSVQWKSWFTWMRGREGAPDGSSPNHFRQTRSPRQITRIRGHMSDSFPFYWTRPLLLRTPQ